MSYEKLLRERVAALTAQVAALTAENERLTRINAELCDALDPVGRIERALEAEGAALPSSRETTEWPD